MNYSREELASLINENKEKIISIVVIIATLIIAVSIYKDQSRRLQLLNTEREMEIKKNIVLNDIKQSEEKIEFYKGLISEKSPLAIISKIKGIATDANINIISIQPGPGEQKPLYTEYPFVLTIGAQSYHAIGGFISKIENYSDLYSVHKVSITSSRGSQTSDKLTVDLTLTIIAFTG